MEIKDSPKLGALKSVHESWLNDKNEVLKIGAMLFIVGAPILLLLTPFIGVWLGIGLVTGLLIFVCVIPFFNFHSDTLPALLLYQKGLALRTPSGVQEVAWNEIESVRVAPSAGGGYSLSNVHACTVRTTFGTVLEINGKFARPDVLVRSAIQESSLHLLPKFLERIQQGERLKFGALELDRNALSFSTRLPMTWASIRNAKSDGVNVLVYFKDNSRPLSVSVAAVPNYFVVCELINKLVRL